MTAALARATLVALLLASGPVSPAQVAGMEAPTRKLVPESRLTWPSGAVEEVRHGRNSMSLYFSLGPDLLEVRMTGDEQHLEMWVTLAGESRYVDYDALLESQSPPRQSGRRSSMGRERPAPRMNRQPTAGEIHNTGVLRWLDSRTGAAFGMAEADRIHLAEFLLGATLAKGSCEGNIRGTAMTTAAWLSCIHVTAASGGTALPFCVLIGSGAYFKGVAALQACGGGGGNPFCSCTGSAPDCMCCDVEPGDVCTCYCGDEECCDWETAD